MPSLSDAPLLTGILVAIGLVVVPGVLFAGAGAFMMRATGRARFRQRRREPQSTPLNFRFKGYGAKEAEAYWAWLGPEGRQAEHRFLVADMFFPLWYGGLFCAGLISSWHLVGRPFPVIFVLAPAFGAVVVDWLENLVHLRELARVQTGQSVEPGLIAFASLSTSAKLACFMAATVLMVGMALWVAVTGIQ